MINQGPANVAYVMDVLRESLADYRLQAFQCRFLSSVRDGDRVEAGGVITAVAEDRIDCEVWLKLEGGATALSAQASLVRRP
ncbi:hypothetical protein [Phenylobacterium sp. J367]|uniref:hypothetical protein n=1 Tax=Phenylobacterium sp. J367 TaxID=2898435 RepID=UPI002151B4C5|nr:hypothetical protein [Phenylobacterium sp. J367]MCR5879575.1 hypothetical protein [Phenylobacterium sp. J367]